MAGLGARALSVALQSNVHLTTLNLRLNDIGDQGANALFHSVSAHACTHAAQCDQRALQLVTNNTLKRLNVSFNNLSPRIGSALR